MNDKAHMQTQNGFITLLIMFVLYLHAKEIKVMYNRGNRL